MTQARFAASLFRSVTRRFTADVETRKLRLYYCLSDSQAMPRYLLIGVLIALSFNVRADDSLSVANLARIRDAAMHSDYAYKELAILTDQIGPRLSGSIQAQAAVKQTAAALKQLGLNVGLVPVSVPHWVRGYAHAALVDYPGRPSGVLQRLAIAALGNSPATPKNGITAAVLVVHDFDELQLHAAQVRGRIVLFDAPFDQNLADNGYANTAYLQVAQYRFNGPAQAARLGAVAALVSAAGGGDDHLPHTGMTVWTHGDHRIPAASLAQADAALIDRLAQRGPVRLHLVMTSHRLPNVQSHDVLADLRGSSEPDQVVIVSGHLDSWDLATGAQDDAVGVVAAMGVAAVFKQLNLHPRRTLRVVAWMNEENGLSGAHAYVQDLAASLPDHVAAIESDNGSGRPLGIAADILPQDAYSLASVFTALHPLGVSVFTQLDQSPGADIAPLAAVGVPGFAPLVDTRHYFDVHHSAADTLDQVDPENLRRQVAVMAVLSWWLANADILTRLPQSAAEAGGD